MRLSNTQAVARPQLWDRNPLTKVAFNFGLVNVAPHTATTRATYTVPVGRKSQFSGGNLNVDRATAATTGGEFQIALFIAPSGGGAAAALVAQCIGNSIDSARETSIQSGAVLNAGDVASIQTQDGSVVGTVNYWGGLFVTEGDA